VVLVIAIDVDNVDMTVADDGADKIGD